MAVTITAPPPRPGAISGPDTVCSAYDIQNYSVVPLSGITSYDWSVPSGAVVTTGVGTNVVTIDFGSADGLVCVRSANSCGVSDTTCMEVLVHNNPTGSTILGSRNYIGRDSSNVRYYVSPYYEAVGYRWTITGGATLRSTDGMTTGSTITTTDPQVFADFRCVSPSTTQITMTVTAFNFCGNSTTYGLNTGTYYTNMYYYNSSGSVVTYPSSSSYPNYIRLNDVITPSISGTSSITRDSDPQTFTATNVPPSISYSWSVTGDAAIIGASDGTSVVIDFSCFMPTSIDASQTAVVTLNYETPCGSFSVTRNVTVGTITPGTISPTASVKRFDSPTTYSIAALSNADSYVWTVSGGATILSGTGTNSISLSYACFDTMMSTCTLTVWGSNSDCGIYTMPRQRLITVVPDTLTLTTSSTTVYRFAASPYTYTVTARPGAETYSWTLSGGATIVSGLGTNSITADFSCFDPALSTCTLSVYATNSCGSMTRARVLLISVPHTSLSSISTTATVYRSNTSVSASIPAVSGAASYNWTATNGATIASGDGTRTVTINYNCVDTIYTNSLITCVVNNACEPPYTRTQTYTSTVADLALSFTAIQLLLQEHQQASTMLSRQ